MRKKGVLVIVQTVLLSMFIIAVAAVSVSDTSSYISTDHEISLAEAAQMTAAYRLDKAPDERLGGYFSRTAIEDILDQEDAVGIRYYYGLDEGGERVLVLVGADQNGNDLTAGAIREKSFPCPPWCADVNSPLYSGPRELLQ